jgi:hypothetical protein
MRISHEEFETLAETFNASNRHPPQTALYAFAALLADGGLIESIGECFTVNARTVWALTGITDKSLIRVQASSACDSWGWSEKGTEEDRQGEVLEATLWPLSAVRSLKVSGVRDTTWEVGSVQFEYDAAWAVTLRGGDEVSVPASEMMSNRVDIERANSLIDAIRSHI